MEDSDNSREIRLARSWRTNAAAWTSAVREQKIASRRAGTDAAIVEAVLSERPSRVLDVGCGEGWLARALAVRGCAVVGIDSSPELIAAADGLGGARFEVAAYAQLEERAAEFGAFDLAVCNFSLLGEDLAAPLQAVRAVLRDGGRLIVQTVHPWIACGDAPYVNGWRVETFAGFDGEFREPMPWYFRTLASWVETLQAGGFVVERLLEPTDAATGKPLSLLIRGALQDERPIE